ncbi:peptidylprolyl isomerase fpr4 [Entophlyctis luteolus]|nr:peptidylprolyl isomerase fpr4 [Entophlyctis luteolus]
MTAIAFWGLTCEPETGYSQLVEQSFRLTNIAIDPKTTAKNGTRVSVSVQSGNNQFTIANLLVGSVEQCVVDLTFSEGEEISFTVVGSATVHLTGNYIMDEIPGEEDDDEDEEIISDDEDNAAGMDVFFNEDGEAVDADGNLIDISELIGDDDEDDDADIAGEDDDDDDEEAEAEALAEIQKALDKKRRVADSKKPVKKPKIEELIDDEEGTNEKAPTANEKKDTPAAVSNGDQKLSKKEKKKLQKQLREEQPKPSEKQEKSSEQLNEKQNDKKQKEKKDDSSSQKKVTKHPNGMIIEEVVEGSGPIAKVGSRVGVRYVGKLTNGKVFDSSTSGKPFEFKLGKGEVIKGWDIGVNGMKVGGARKITIPPALAYGAQGAPPDIPKNATLVFEVKLLTIK